MLQPDPEARAAHAAVRAFNVELVQVRAKVSNEDHGRVRMAWFRSAIESLSESDGKHPSTPVMDALAEVTTPSMNEKLTKLIDAREDELAYPNIPTLEALEASVRGTHGVLAELHAEILGLDCTDKAGIGIKSAGVAVGLAVALRGVPANAHSRISCMPRELMRTHGASESDMLKGTGEGCKRVFQDVAESARKHAANARKNTKNKMERKHRPSLWGLKIVDTYLDALEKGDYNPFDPKLRHAIAAIYPIRLQMALLGARITGRV